MYFKFPAITNLPRVEQFTYFYYLADCGGLVKDGRYIGGTPNENITNDPEVKQLYDYLNDWIDFPKPGIIPKEYLDISLVKLKLFQNFNLNTFTEEFDDEIQTAIDNGEEACKELIEKNIESTIRFFKWDDFAK